MRYFNLIACCSAIPGMFWGRALSGAADIAGLLFGALSVPGGCPGGPSRSCILRVSAAAAHGGVLFRVASHGRRAVLARRASWGQASCIPGGIASGRLSWVASSSGRPFILAELSSARAVLPTSWRVHPAHGVFVLGRVNCLLLCARGYGRIIINIMLA